MTVSSFARTLFLVDIVKGLALTLRTLFSRPVTRQYPEDKLLPAPGFRGLHALPRKVDGTARCVGCGLCAAACPSQCILVQTSDGPDHKKIVERYEIDVLKCLFCALCVEACPFQAIALTDHFEYAGFSKDELFMDKERLMANWDRVMAGPKGDGYFEHFWKPRSADFSKVDGQARQNPPAVEDL